MSDYDMTFAKKLLSDQDFDTIFGAEEDDRLMRALKEDGDFIKDDPDTKSVEDGYGDLGKGTGLGSDLGTDHETKGAAGAKDDTSDEDIISAASGETFSKGKQLNTGDNAQGGIKDGSQSTGDFHVAGDNADAVDKTFEQAFQEAYNALMEDVNEELGYDPAGGAEYVPPAEEPPVPAAYGNPNATGNFTDDILDAEDDDDEDEAYYNDCGASCNKPSCAPKQPGFYTPPVQEEGDVSHEERDPGRIEDGNKSENLGDEIGPKHDGNGVSKPADDTSDQDIIDIVAGETLGKGDQLNTGDNAQGGIKDGSQATGDLRVAGDDDKAADNSFSEGVDSLDDEEVEDNMIADVKDSNDGEASDEVVNKLIADEEGDSDDDIMDLI